MSLIARSHFKPGGGSNSPPIIGATTRLEGKKAPFLELKGGYKK